MTAPKTTSDYERGYLDGYRDARAEAEVADPSLLPTTAGEHEAKRSDLREAVGDTTLPGDESDYWLGYYHGRTHGLNGTPAAVALKRGEIPGGLI